MWKIIKSNSFKGNSINQLKDTKITAGAIYFFKDGNIVWDCDNTDRIIMNPHNTISTTIENIKLKNNKWNSQTIKCSEGTYIIQLILKTANKITCAASGVCSLYDVQDIEPNTTYTTNEEIQLHYSLSPDSGRLYATAGYENQQLVLQLITDKEEFTSDYLEIKLQKIF